MAIRSTCIPGKAARVLALSSGWSSHSPGRGASLDKASAITLSLPGILWGKMDSDYLLQKDRMSCSSLVTDRDLKEPCFSRAWTVVELSEKTLMELP